MYDSTTVHLTVLKAHYDTHVDAFESPDDVFESPSIGPVSALDSPNLLTLAYDDVQFSSLGFEEQLRQLRIPYDKSWGTSANVDKGEEYFRISPFGDEILLEFECCELSHVELDKVIEAFQAGNIKSFLESAKNDRMPISWSEQHTILEAMERTHASLQLVDQSGLDALVAEMCCEVSKRLQESDDERAQEQAIEEAELSAVNINNSGKDEQISFLIKHGYLADGCVRHATALFSL